jgi:hypothetical protein
MPFAAENARVSRVSCGEPDGLAMTCSRLRAIGSVGRLSGSAPYPHSTSVPSGARPASVAAAAEVDGEALRIRFAPPSQDLSTSAGSEFSVAMNRSAPISFAAASRRSDRLMTATRAPMAAA